MKSGCSESKLTAVCWSAADSTASCHQTSRPSTMVTSDPVRFRVTTFSTEGAFFTAASTWAFSGTSLPRRQAASWVSTTLTSASLSRSRTASAAKPPKITVCTAPIRAQASIPMAASGTMPM